MSKEDGEPGKLVFEDIVKEVALCHVTAVLGDWKEYASSTYPSWESCDLVAELFADQECYNYVEEHKRIIELPVDKRKSAIKKQARNEVPEMTPEPIASECRRSKRSNPAAANDMIEIEEEVDGELVKKVVAKPVPSPVFKERLDKQQADMSNRLRHSASLYKKLAAHKNAEGVVELPTEDKKPTKKKPKKYARSGEDEILIQSLRSKVRKLQQTPTSSQTTSSLQLSKELQSSKSSLATTESDLGDARTLIFTLNERVAVQREEIASLKGQLAVAAAQKDAAVANARADVMEKCMTMSRPTPIQGRSHSGQRSPLS